MKISVNKNLIKEEEINKNSIKSASKATNTQHDFSKSEGRNIELSPKVDDKDKIFYLLNKNNIQKTNQLKKKSRNIINTKSRESSLKLFSFRRKCTDFKENFNTGCLKKSVINSNDKNKNQKKSNCYCSLKEFRKNIVIDYTNNYLKNNKNSKNSKNKSVIIYDSLKNCIDDTASSTNNFNNSGLLYKCNYKNNRFYSSSKNKKKIINVNLKTEKRKKYNKNNIMYSNNKTNTSAKKKTNKKIIRNNFKPHSNLESYISKNNAKINIININKINTEYSKYASPVSRNTHRREKSPFINSLKKQKINRKTFNNINACSKNSSKKKCKKFNKIFPINNNRIIKSTRNKRKSESQNTINKNIINLQANKTEFEEIKEDFSSVEEIHFIFVKIAQKQKMFFQSKN